MQFMVNLHTLSLDYCRLQGDLAGIGCLKMLIVLSFFHSIVKMFPSEIAELTNLQCLDLRFKLEHPTTLPLGTLSSLKELEELYLGDIVSQDIESLKEIRSLSKLHTIQFVVSEDNSCLDVLLENLDQSKLIRFEIARIPRGFGLVQYQIKENGLELRGDDVHVYLYLLKALMWKVKWFYLEGKKLAEVVDVLSEDSGFQNLKYFRMYYGDMKYLVDATNHRLPKGVFSKLETLFIGKASQLEELIHGDYPLGNLNASPPFQCPLGNLKTILILKCAKIKSLFSKSMMNSLGKLESIKMDSCPVLERIVRIQKDDEAQCSEVCELSKLKHLLLKDLPGFKSLKNVGVMAGFNQAMPKLEYLTIKLRDIIKERREDEQEMCFYLGCSLPKVRNLRVADCNNLFTIAKHGLVHGFQDLQTLQVWTCWSLEVVFDFAETEETTLLGRLELLDLYSLPNLKHILRMLPPKRTVFQNLKRINVQKCSSLRYLMTPTITNMLVHLEEIELKENALMEAIIGRRDGEEILLERLMLPNLKSLIVQLLPCNRKLCCCSPDLTLELPLLSNVQLPSLMVQEIFKIYKISSLTSVKIGEIGGSRSPFSPSSGELLYDRRYPFTPSSAELLLCLRKLELCDEQIQAILGSEGSSTEDASEKSIAFPKLQKLTIDHVWNFRKFCFSPDLNLELPSLTELQIINSPIDILARETYALQNLTTLKVEDCITLSYLFTSTTAQALQALVHLQELALHSNKSMTAIFGDDISKTIVLPKLKKLELSCLPHFKMLSCSLNLSLDLSSLTQLHIKSCPKMSKLCVGQMSAPQLEHVKYDDMDTNYDTETEIALGTFIDSWLKDCEAMTRCLNCRFHNIETCHHFSHFNHMKSEWISNEAAAGTKNRKIKKYRRTTQAAKEQVK